MSIESERIFGVLLIASWVNTLLYTLEASQARRYLKMYSNHDPPLIRWMVILCLFLNGANLLAECACVYLYAVTHWGDKIYVQYQDWPIPMYIMATSMTGFVVQSFLIRRYYYLSKRPLVTWALLLLAFGALGGAFASATIIILHNDYHSRHIIFVPVIVWLVLSAATDCAIAAALVAQLRLMRSELKSSKSLIQRITVTTIQTGAASSIVALTALGTFVPFVDTNIPTFFGFCLGCVYSLTMLHNLNERNNLAGNNHDDTTDYHGEPGSLGFNLTAILAKHPSTMSRVASRGVGQQRYERAALNSDNTTTTTSFPSSPCEVPTKLPSVVVESPASRDDWNPLGTRKS